MKKVLFMACLLCCTAAAMADDAQKVNASELSKVTFDGNKVILHYKNGTTANIEDMETVTIDFSSAPATSIDERTAITTQAGLEGKQVYNLNGQLVGNSAARLTKGVYIIDGKKVIVK